MKRLLPIALFAILCLTGCVPRPSASSPIIDSPTGRFELISDQSIDGRGIEVYRDRQTGNQYLVVGGSGVVLMPRTIQ